MIIDINVIVNCMKLSHLFKFAEGSCSPVLPQFSFVTIHGTAKLVRQKYNELLKWNTRIAERYMGKSNAKAYGKRNTTEGVILVRVKPTKIIADCYR